MKSNVGYINFLCEYWLRAQKVSTVRSIFENKNKWFHFHSSIELTECDKGKPYGVLGFICQKRRDVTYHNYIEQ